VVQLLIEGGAKLDDYDVDGRHALLAAAYAHNVVMFWVLLDRLEVAVDVHVRDSDGLTLDDIPRMLLANGARVDDRNFDGSTALDLAHRRGSDAVVECLLEYVEDANAARAKVRHPISLSDPSERLRLTLRRAIEQDRKKGRPEPTPLYCRGSTNISEKRLGDDNEAA
jgi:ankyrin repeat protein